ncbi:uncharacterized protein LOC102712111 [Oryza brachyantha]|uniref:F-box domain-containing protein n=1 Tax=Oryza brachyantha TaxID=4533 RepID=J3MYV7_ORYBR|nr:uncharacterized protein LOC102712111 [Oryza brachyantha]
MAKPRDRRRRRRRAANGDVTSLAIKKGTLCQEYDNPRDGKRLRYSWQNLPEDIWCHIHSRMTLQDAARAACVSRAFLRSWRFHPNLIFTEETPSLEQNARRKGDKSCAFASTVDHILENHSGIGVKRLKIMMDSFCNTKITSLNSWFQKAITPGIEEITLAPPSNYNGDYSFPFSLVFDRSRSSIRYLELTNCTIHPTVSPGCLTSLTELCLRMVHIKDEELGCLLSMSCALEDLQLMYCREIRSLKIPSMLERLSHLTISGCYNLQMVECKAPNLSTFSFTGGIVQLSLGESSQVKSLYMACSSVPNFTYNSIPKLPYIVPNIRNLTLSFINEGINTPTIAARFLHLKHLEINLYANSLPPGYDYFSLISFFDASPFLESFILRVHQVGMKHISIFEDDSHMRQTSEHQHASLKNVMILGFCSAKSMVELACHILENATKLKSITLDTVLDAEDEDNIGRCCTNSTRKIGKCTRLTREMILEAERGSVAIERYILGAVSSGVELTVRGACSWCHDIERAKSP